MQSLDVSNNFVLPDPEVVEEEESLEDLSEGRGTVASSESTETDEDADDALSYFQKLAED